MGRKIGNKL